MSDDNAVPIRVLLITVFESIAEVFLLCLAGFILSYVGITDKATQRKLNVINVSLFTPALLFSKVAFSLTPSKLKEMWIIPLGFVIISGLSAAVAWFLSKLFRLKKSQTAFAICAAMFQNSNSLPIALIQSLVIEVPGLRWGAEDTKDQMLGRALTYLVLYSTLGMMLRWSWGVKLLSKADDEAPDVGECIQPAQQASQHLHVQSPEPLDGPHPGARETDPFFTQPNNMSQDEADEARNPTRSFGTSVQRSLSPASSWVPDLASAKSAHPMSPPLRRNSRQHSFGGRSGVSGRSNSRQNSNSPHPGHPTRRTSTRAESGREFWGLPEAPRRHLIDDLPEDSSDDEEAHDDEEWGGDNAPLLRRRAPDPPSTRLQALVVRFKEKTQTALSTINAFMTVPMYAALLSIFIAMIPPLQAALGKAKPIEQAIKSAGNCSIPVTLVVLGAFFYAPADPTPPIALPTVSEHSPGKSAIGGYFERKFRALQKPGNPAYPGENRAVFVAVISRMIIVPALMLPFIALIARYDAFEAAEDPVFILSAVLLVSSPPALTLAQITQAASGDAFERLISKTITWSYAILTPPLTLAYVVIGLLFGRL